MNINYTMTRFMLGLGVVFSAWVLEAQVSIKGKVLDAQGKAISLATVQSFRLPDTTFVVGASVDAQGAFAITLPEGIALDKTFLRVRCLGYKTQDVRLPAPQPLTLKLEDDEQLLGEVQVVARARGQQVDSRAFRFSEQVQKVAQSSQELMRFLPEVQVDPLSGAIKALSGGSVQLLINGIKATLAQLKSLPAHYVKEVIYYDVPPARYAHASAVIDVIAPRADSGLDFGFQGQGALTTGFVDATAYLTLNRGRHQFATEYTLSHRNYQDRLSEQEYSYTLGGEAIHNLIKQKDDFGYTIHRPTLRYTHQLPQKQIVQASLSPEFETRHNGGATANIYERGALRSLSTADISSKSHYWAPVADVYYSRTLSPKSEISATALVSLYSTEKKSRNHEVGEAGEAILTDDMHLRNKSLTLSGEVAYSLKTKLGQWNTGYSLERTSVDYKVDNSLGYQEYTTANTKHYAYTELRGRVGKFGYQAQLGFTNLVNNQAGHKYVTNAITPSLTLSQTLGSAHTLRLSLSYKPYAPSISLVSNNRLALTRDIISRGNPLLETSHYYFARLLYSYRSKVLDLNLQSYYTLARNPFVIDYKLSADARQYESTQSNGRRYERFGTWANLTFKPFGNLLSLRIMAEPHRVVYHTDNGRYAHNAVNNYFILTGMYKSLVVQYALEFAPWNFSGLEYGKSRERHNLYAKYQTGGWGFFLGWSLIGGPTSYYGYTVEGLPVAYRNQTLIYDNKNMVILGLTYSFSSGKQKQVERSLQLERGSSITF